jgi:chromosome segregation ATPase
MNNIMITVMNITSAYIAVLTLLLFMCINCTIRILESNEITIKDELQSTKVRLEKLKLEVVNTDQVNEELMKRMDAESENATLARERAEVAIRQKEQLEQQLEKLQDAYEKSLKRCEVMEESEANLNSSMLTLQSELAQTREECSDLETALEEAAGMQVLAQEVETLRAQLTDVRKKLAKRDIEEDVDRLTPATMLEREKNNRKVYEKLIDDLRGQLDKMTVSYHDSKQKLTDAGLRLLRVEELEEQIQIYKENSVKYSHESMW